MPYYGKRIYLHFEEENKDYAKCIHWVTEVRNSPQGSGWRINTVIGGRHRFRIELYSTKAEAVEAVCRVVGKKLIAVGDEELSGEVF
jgi:hypothetical protein